MDKTKVELFSRREEKIFLTQRKSLKNCVINRERCRREEEQFGVEIDQEAIAMKA
jgi:hypothetical protein